MPKNIYLPKENYKKVEEIRELENQVPTYEEFVSNYNADKKVNNSYENEIESYSDIGVSKGFGPCHYPNLNCSCYVSEGFIPLYMSCPSCSNSNNHV